MQKFNSSLKQFVEQDENFLQLCRIRSIPELDQKIRNINDIYVFQALIEQLSLNLPRVIYDRAKFTQIVKRLIEAVCFALEKYAYDVTRTTYLIDRIAFITRYWKKFLLRESEFSVVIKNQSKFMITLEKNEFWYFLIKTSTQLLEKDVFRLVKSKIINVNSLFYLKKCKINDYWQSIHQKMLIIGKQTQNQCHLKIQLFIEFLKYTLFQLNFCIKLKDFDRIFQKFYGLTFITFRLIKKFYSLEIIEQIKSFKNILLRGLQINRKAHSHHMQKNKNLLIIINLIEKNKLKRIKQKKQYQRNQIKKRTLQFVIQETNDQQIIQNYQNPKGYAIKLALRLLKNWKTVNSKKNKQIKLRQQTLKPEIQAPSLFMFQQKQKNQQEYVQKQNNINYSREINVLKHRSKRCRSAIQIKNQNPSINNIRIRKEIQQQLYKQFGKLKYLRQFNENKSIVNDNKSKQKKSGSRIKTKSLISGRNTSKFSIKQYFKIGNKQNSQEKQVTVEEYRTKLKMCRKNIQTVNKIKFYKPEKHDSIIRSSVGQHNIQLKSNIFSDNKFSKRNIISESKIMVKRNNGEKKQKLKL